MREPYWGRIVEMEEICFASATQIVSAIRNRELSSQEVVSAYQDRLEEVNSRLNAVTVVASDAPEQARLADQKQAQGEELGPLHGLPFTVKDTFETAGLQSPLDIRIRQRQVSRTDATVVARMKQAGAILLAKTNCPPAGSGADTENAVIGQTRNPHNAGCSPGGSSGGEAALIGAGGSPLGLGSDTGGGLRVPAAFCGVSALKPTQGRVPNTGVYNQPGGFTDQRTQIGPAGRSVEDLLLALRIIAGPDYFDGGVVSKPLYDPDQLPLRDLTIATFPYDPSSLVTSAVANAVGASGQALARAGVQVVENRPLDLVGGARDLDRGWRQMAATRGQDVVELLYAWDQFRTNLLQYIRYYDAILCPAVHHTAPSIGARDNQRFDYTVPFSLTGYPAAVVPVTVDVDGLPVAVQIVSHPWREDIVFALALALEEEFKEWQKDLHGGLKL
ncbi:MAG: amidase [Caldilineaceae bacterium]|nr:amidase [Caldilineaceae bacterium]